MAGPTPSHSRLKSTPKPSASSVVTRMARPSAARSRAPTAWPTSFSATKANASSTNADTAMNCSSTWFPATAAEPTRVPALVNHAKANSSASVRIITSRLTVSRATQRRRSHSCGGTRSPSRTNHSPNSNAVHSATAVPAPIPVGPHPRPTTKATSRAALVPLSTPCSASRPRVRPHPSSQPFTAYTISAAGAPKIRAFR